MSDEVKSLAAAPEGVSVFVVTPSEPTAKLVAPELARQLYPGRTFGRVLHIEWMRSPDGTPGFEVVLEAEPLVTTKAQMRAEDRPR